MSAPDVDLFGEPVASARVASAAAEWLPGVQAAMIADGVRRQDARVLEHADVFGAMQDACMADDGRVSRPSRELA